MMKAVRFRTCGSLGVDDSRVPSPSYAGRMNVIDYCAAGLAAFGAGTLNAVVGGGTLITFPTLLALGVPPVAANMTNTVALCSGYLSGSVAQIKQLKGQRARMLPLVAFSVLGGLTGAALLRVTSDDSLRTLVPVLLGLATLLLALQPRLKRMLGRDAAADGSSLPDARWLPFAIGVVAVYGGFFGAGLGVMLLATLGIGIHLPLTASNAIKQALSLVINVTAAAFFVFSGKVWWWLVLVMAIGSMLGGALGGRLVSRLDPAKFRLIVVVAGTALTIYYAIKVLF
jgi:uncharacterized protein